METVILILVVLVVVVFLLKRSALPSFSQQCPPGYVPSPVNSTWAGWQYNCLPEGIENTMAGIPSNTDVPPLVTVYSPVIENTGVLATGEPAKIKQFAGHPTVYSPAY